MMRIIPLIKIAGFQVAGGFDPNPERAIMMRDKFNIPILYESLEQAVAQAPANAVFDVAVPGRNVLSVLEKIPDGRAVLVQKPMGEDLEQARAILKLCRQKNLTAAINFQLRFAPFIIAARDMIDRGMIGEVNDMEMRVQVYTPWQLWEFLNTAPRLEIVYHSIHYVDLFPLLFG